MNVTPEQLTTLIELAKSFDFECETANGTPDDDCVVIFADYTPERAARVDAIIHAVQTHDALPENVAADVDEIDPDSIINLVVDFCDE